MKIISCPGCGVVLDDTHLKAITPHVTRPWESYFKCPVCKKVNHYGIPLEIQEIPYEID